MSISRQNLTIIIVTLKSENVIHQCIKSIGEDIPIIIVENSSNSKVKIDLENKYKNVKCSLVHKNIGMGKANNHGIKLATTDYVFILNPDVIFNPNTIDELILEAKKVSDFGIISPISSNIDYPNYSLFNSKPSARENSVFKVKNVDGFAMLLNKKKLNKILNKKNLNDFNEINYFDPNFFMYLENNDLCKRVISNGGNIYVTHKSIIKHLAAKSVDFKYSQEIELSRNWHWIWSKFYFNKKHFGFFAASLEGLPRFFASLFKYMFFLLINNKVKKNIYFNRASGFFSAFVGKSSWYRPKIDD